MIAALVLVAYGIIGLLSARYAYGKFRALAIAEAGLDWWNDEEEALPVIICTILCFLLWPLFAVGYAIFGNPPKTDKELEEENKELSLKLERMERDAGLRK